MFYQKIKFIAIFNILYFYKFLKWNRAKAEEIVFGSLLTTQCNLPTKTRYMYVCVCVCVCVCVSTISSYFLTITKRERVGYHRILRSFK